MARKIIIEVKGQEYSLGVDRKTIVNLEKRGFNIENMKSQTVNTTLLLWVEGMKKFIPTMSDEKALSVYDDYLAEGGDTGEVFEFLAEEYEAFIKTIQPNTEATKKARIVE